jgi:ABC-type transport system involved in multi-copper enzyme maturation permease subunit
MMISLIRKEILDNLLSFRFVVSSVIVILIMTLSVGILMQDYSNRRNNFNQNINAHYEHTKTYDNYMELMFSGIGVERPPAELQFFYAGVEKNPNRAAHVYPFIKPSFSGELNVNPVFPLFPVVDLLFVVAIVMSLLAFVFSYDAVCGERENGTLKLLMSYSIPRDRIILAKWIGGYVTLIIPYIIGVAICALMALLNPKVSMSGEGWAAFLLTIIVSLLFIAVMFSIGLFVSVLTKISAASISILLFIWVILVLIIPNAVPFVVDQIKPIDSPSQVMSRIKYKSGNTMDGLIDTTIKTFEDATGIALEDVDFGQERGNQQESKAEPAKKQEPSSSQSSSSSASKQQQQQDVPAVDMKELEKIVGQISDNDLRELQLRGCKSWIDKQLKQQVGMTIDQAQKMAKDMGYDIDVNALLRQCEENKNELIAMRRSGKSAEEIARESAGGQTQTTKPAAQEQQRQKVKPQEVISKYMSLSETEKGRAIDKMYSAFINAFKNNSEISRQEEESYQNSINAQVKLTKNLSRISPVSSYVYAVTDLANTGIEREQHLKEYLWSYQNRFLDFLDMKFSVPDSEKVHSLFGGFFREAPYSVDELPRFSYQEMPISQRLSHAIVDIGVLIFFIIVTFMAAFLTFLRAEIID